MNKSELRKKGRSQTCFSPNILVVALCCSALLNFIYLSYAKPIKNLWSVVAMLFFSRENAKRLCVSFHRVERYFRVQKHPPTERRLHVGICCFLLLVDEILCFDSICLVQYLGARYAVTSWPVRTFILVTLLALTLLFFMMQSRHKALGDLQSLQNDKVYEYMTQCSFDSLCYSIPQPVQNS
jgi:hypothetical protein